MLRWSTTVPREDWAVSTRGVSASTGIVVSIFPTVSCGWITALVPTVIVMSFNTCLPNPDFWIESQPEV